MIKKYLVTSASTGLARTVGSALFSAVLIPLIIRNMGMENYGIWSIAFIFTGLTATLDIGIPKALVLLISGSNDKKEANQFFTACIIITLLLIGVIVSVGILGILFDPPVWGNEDKISRSTGRILIMTGTIIISSSLIIALCNSLLEAYYKIYIVNIASLSFILLHYALVYAASCVFKTVEYLIYATNLAYCTMALLSILLVSRFTTIGFTHTDRERIKTVISKGKDFFAIGLITSIPNPLMRYLIVFLAADMTAAGVYDIAMKIALLGNAALASFTIPLFSLFSGYGEKNIAKIKQVMMKMHILLFTLLTVGILAYIFIGYDVIALILDNNDPRLLYSSLILLTGWGIISAFEPSTRALWALGHTQKCVAVRASILIINVFLVFALFFIPEPLYRISLAVAISLASGGVMFFLLFIRLYGFRQSATR